MATFESVDFNPMAASPLDFALNAEGIKGALADLARGVYQQESGSGKNIESAASRKSGARGGMQILPSTFASVADKDWNIDDPVQNARGGVRYLQQLYDQAGGDAKLAAIGYYGGPGAMAKARKGVAVSDPRNADAPTTLQYGDQVMSEHGAHFRGAPVRHRPRHPPRAPCRRCPPSSLPHPPRPPYRWSRWTSTPSRRPSNRWPRSRNSSKRRATRQTRINVAGAVLPSSAPF